MLHRQNVRGCSLLRCAGANMALMYARFSLLLLWFVEGQATSDNDLSEGTAAEQWEKLSKSVYQDSDSQSGVFYGRSISNMPDYRPPDFMPVLQRDVQADLFIPEKGTRPLPLSIKEMLLKATAPTPTIAPARENVELLCHVDRMLVRVRTDAFKQNVTNDLKLGKCHVNGLTPEHYYFIHPLASDCGFRKEVGTSLFSQYVH